jgi:hypothetical protein
VHITNEYIHSTFGGEGGGEDHVDDGEDLARHGVRHHVSISHRHGLETQDHGIMQSNHSIFVFMTHGDAGPVERVCEGPMLDGGHARGSGQ